MLLATELSLRRAQHRFQGPKLNINALVTEAAQKLGLEKRAELDALDGIPAENDQPWTETESVIKAEVDSIAQRELSRVGKCCRNTEASVREYSETRKATSQKRHAKERQGPTVENLGRLEKDVASTTAQYKGFKAEHGLRREASGEDRLAQAAWVGVVVVVEGVLNSYFFAPILEHGGLIGGMFIAAIFSIVNVGFAFLGGLFGVHHLNHKNPSNKLLGLIVTIVCIMGCALTIALSSWFRGHVDSLQESVAVLDLSSEAWTHTLVSLRELDWWGLIASLNSFLLMFIGILCACFGFVKGAAYDDPYPGFGNLLRQKQRAEEILRAAEIRNQEHAEEWKNGVKHLQRNLDDKFAATSVDLDGFREALDATENFPSQICQVWIGLLQTYREKNESIRADSPPKYFGEFPTCTTKEFHAWGEKRESQAATFQRLENVFGKLKAEHDEEKLNLQRALQSL